MARIEISEIGRNAPEPLRYPVLSGRDPLFVLALELESYFDQGAIISPINGETDSYVVMRVNRPFQRPVIRVRIVDVGIESDEEVTQRIEAVVS